MHPTYRTPRPRRLIATLLVLAAATVVHAQVEPTLDQLHALRAELAAFEEVDLALDAGFGRFGDCMSGPQGAQGVHFTHGDRIGDPAIDVLDPEVLMYEPRPDGSLRLIGAEYLVLQRAWHEQGHVAPPVLLGREFTLNTTLLDEPFYALHVWVWQHNPLGVFANWNPLVDCTQDMAGGDDASRPSMSRDGSADAPDGRAMATDPCHSIRLELGPRQVMPTPC